MKALLPLIFATSVLSSPALAQKEPMTEKATAHIKPPIAAKRPHQTTYHGVTITDDYTEGDILSFTGNLPSGIHASAFNSGSRNLSFYY